MKIQRSIQYACAVLLIFVAPATIAAAECQLRLEVDDIHWRGGTGAGYGVFDPGEYAQTVSFKVRLTGDPCPFFVTFSSSAPGGDRRAAVLGSENLEYQIYDTVNRRTRLKSLPGANENEVIRGTFGPGEEVKELTCVIVVPPEQAKPSGRYIDLIRIAVYQGTPDNFVEKDSRTVTFSAQVDEVTELSLVQSDTSFDPRAKAHKLDFERIARSKAKRFDLRVRSNSGYQILLNSENGGVMKSADPGIQSTIPYFLEIEGRAVNLAGHQQSALSRNNRLTDRHGDRHEVKITIGEIGNATAGTYRDTITVTVVSD